MTVPIATSTIAAQAFRLMELSPISSFADDSAQAQAAAEQYPIALTMCLEAADWSFASVLAKLPEASLPSGAAIDDDLTFAYQLPGDCVVLREVVDPTVRWRRDRDLLRADAAGPLAIRYTGQTSNEAALPATFQTAVAFQLAALLAPIWTGTQSKVSRLEQAGSVALRQAMRIDARQASAARYDGRPMQGDWATEAVR